MQQMKFFVERNYCHCHPETCGCDDWNIVNELGHKVCSFYHKSRAEDHADLLNKALPGLVDS